MVFFRHQAKVLFKKPGFLKDRKNHLPIDLMSDSKKALNYPIAPSADIVDDCHGVKIADPYRWLEDPESEETQRWIKEENEVTFCYLEEVKEREEIKQRLTEIWDYEKYGVPFKQGDRYFYYKNDGLQNQNVLYTLTNQDDEPKVLIDPNTWSEDGTVALSGIAISQDGKLLAYGLSVGGSDWQEWRVLNIETGEYSSEVLQWIKFYQPTFAPDNKGLFYSRYEAPQKRELEEVNYLHKVYYHALGTAQSEDVLIYERPDKKEWSYAVGVTDDGRYLVISVWQSTERKNLVLYKDLTAVNSPIVELISEFEAEYSFIDNDGDLFWFLTDLDAPRKRVIEIDIKTGDRREIIPQTDNILQGANTLNNQFVAFYLKDVSSEVKIFNLDGSTVGDVVLPGIGSVGGFSGKRDETETFYSYTNFTTPPTIYRYDFLSGESSIYRQPEIGFNPDEYETKQVFYPSKDGTLVPMFISYKKGIKLDGNNPTILYGYGGFSISITPSFSISRLAWMEMGGVYAIANIRGGGEYGEEWHQAGIKEKKQNVFDDFIAAAEWLIEKNYSSSPKLAITGVSNGGLLVGACLTQRPDLFAAALPGVGVMDMLRFHKFTIGWAWTADFGSPEDPEEFPALLAYSPLHNLKEGTSYPATLITTADRDDRVVPAHSFKFAAALQNAHVGDNPVLIRIETKAGHGGGKPTAKIIEQIADQFAFLVRVFQM